MGMQMGKRTGTVEYDPGALPVPSRMEATAYGRGRGPRCERQGCGAYTRVIFERHESLPIASGSVPLRSKSAGPVKPQESDDCCVGQSAEPQRHTHVPIEIELTSPARPRRYMILGSRPQAHARGPECSAHAAEQRDGKAGKGVCHAMRLKSYSALMPQSAML
jgi:hypothetical protein